MKLRFSKIPPGRGLPLNEELSLKALNKRMQEAKNNEIEFLHAPVLDLLIRKQVQGAEIRGQVTTSFRQPCGRCGDEVEQPLKVDIQLELKRGTASEHGEPLEDDVGIVIVQDDFIPLEEIIQEHIILALSPTLLPECRANGDCSLCGKAPKNDVEEGAGDTFLLGDLLKGVKGKE